MIDAIKLRFYLNGKAEEALLTTAFANHSGELDQKGRLITSLENLKIHFYPNSLSGMVKGSLHTFGMGNNYSDFSLSRIVETIDKLIQVLGLPPERLQVQTMEAGINIPLPVDAQPFLLSLNTFKNKPFRELESVIPYGQFRAALNDYNVKLYNKSRYENLSRSYLLRYELQFKKSRAINRAVGRSLGCPLTLADLTEKSFLHPLANHLLINWKLINRNVELDLSNLTHQQRKLFFAGKDPGYWRSANKNTRKKERREYKQILQQVVKPELCPVTLSLINKLNHFLTGEDYTPFSPHVIMVNNGII